MTHFAADIVAFDGKQSHSVLWQETCQSTVIGKNRLARTQRAVTRNVLRCANFWMAGFQHAPYVWRVRA